MKARDIISILFIIIYGIAMALFGYLGRNSYVESGGMVLMTLIAAGIAAALFWGVWNLDIKRRSAENDALEKRKREPIEAVLQDMSQADLQILKRRLMDADFDSGQLIDEEGELLARNKKR